MLDLTKEIKLDARWQKKYQLLQLALVLVFLAAGIFLSYKVLFPSRSFNFFFQNIGTLKNTIVSPRDSENNPLASGRLPQNNKMIFDAVFPGDFSKAKVALILEKGTASIKSGDISVRKSFQAFFYPEGEPMGMKEGTLAKNNGNYYIVSNGKLRKFSSPQLIEEFGYKDGQFSEAFKEELKYNETADDISDANIYPDGFLFKVESEYYQLKNRTAYRFVSERAFLTQYNQKQLVEKDEIFLKNFEMAGTLSGFADGTLVSSGESAYIVNQDKILPINDKVTFESMGFNWNDIIPASGEEIGIYGKGKLFTLRQPHPDGIIFVNKENSRHFYVQGGKKRELKGPNIIKSYLRNTPVLAEENALKVKSGCVLEKQISFSKKYGCEIPIGNFKNLGENDYQFELASDPNIAIKEIKVTLERNINKNNLKSTLLEIWKRIISNYYG